MRMDEPSTTPRYLYISADGSYGDATDIRFVRADSSLLLSLPEDPSESEMRDFAAEFGTPTLPNGQRTIYTLTTDDGSEVITAVHTSRQDILDDLRVNFADGDDVSDDDLIEHVTSTGTFVYIGEHSDPFVS